MKRLAVLPLRFQPHISSVGCSACPCRGHCISQANPSCGCHALQVSLASGVLQAKRSALGNRHEALISTMAQLVSVRQRLGQQDAAHDLLLEAASILSEQGPESLSSGCQPYCCK